MQDEENFLKELETFQPDLILSDYAMPQFTGLDAMKISKKECPEIPFIIITGSLNEETAVKCMRWGAWDYVIKDKLIHLGHAVKNAIKLKEENEKKKQGEKALQESEQELNAIFNGARDGIALLDKTGKILRINKYIVEIGGYAEEEIVGKRFNALKMFPLKSMSKMITVFSKLIKGQEISYEVEVNTKKGEKKIIEIHNSFLKKEGKVEGVIAILRDITERKQAEKALKATNEKLTMLAQTVTSMKEYVSITNMDGKIIFVNQALLDKYGYKRDEILGKPSEILHSPHNPKDMGKRIHEGTFKVGWKGELLNQTKDGKEFPVELSTSILKDETGKDVALIGIAFDITKRKQAEQIQSVLYKIADAVNTTESLDEFFKIIHNLLGTIVDTTNFYVALYDKETDTISLPYYIDEKDKFTSFSTGKTLTDYVVKTGKPLFGTEEVRERLIQVGNVERGKIGAHAKIWVGVPLKIDKETIGVIAVQSYTDASLYTEKDMEILEFVSDQIAIAVESKKAEESLKKKNIELENFNKIAVGREMRMIDLKKEINELLKKSGKEPKYRIAE